MHLSSRVEERSRDLSCLYRAVLLRGFTIIAEESGFMEQSGGEWTRMLSCLYRAVLLREVYNYSRGECIYGAEWRRVEESVVLFI